MGGNCLASHAPLSVLPGFGNTGMLIGMETNETAKTGSWWSRVRLAVRLVFDGEFAGQVTKALQTSENKAAAPPVKRPQASALWLLGVLQREGRLLDFLQQNVSGFSDEEVGAAARVVHDGCRKVVQQYFDFEPAAKEQEGATVTLVAGFDPQRWRLTGNVSGQPPFRGTLRHHGWLVRELRTPALSESLDERVIAPAEVELA
jgi:hypothetical protein